MGKVMERQVGHLSCRMASGTESAVQGRAISSGPCASSTFRHRLGCTRVNSTVLSSMTYKYIYIYIYIYMSYYSASIRCTHLSLSLYIYVYIDIYDLRHVDDVE